MMEFMKAVIVDVSPDMIEERRRKGIDRFDEVWEGVYHMVPPPAFEHQKVVTGSAALFVPYVRQHRLGVLYLGLGVRDVSWGEKNYRIPEWIFLRAGREHLLKPESGYVDEGPDVVLEVRSPGDETDEKIPFYEKVGVRELVLVDRNSRRVEILRLAGSRFSHVSPNADGWIYCEGLRAFFRTAEREGKPALLVRLELEGTEHAI